MTTFLRRLISATFVASGMLKAVNLDAFGQTVGSFLGLFGLPPGHAYALGALVCAGEMAIGYAAWSGRMYRCVHWLYVLVMAAFTCVTYVNLTEIYGGIESCGCFGELIHLNPAETFYKNVLLLLICLGLSSHAVFVMPKQKINAVRLLKLLSSIAVASVLPIIYSVTFMHALIGEVYLFFYVFACAVSFLIVISSRQSSRIILMSKGLSQKYVK